MGLQRYWKKRNFKETPEPRGKTETPSGRLKYVIQKHAASRLHYDFRLELDGTLKSWAVPKGPSLDPGQKRLAVHVEDHPLDYAGFEGIIPAKQYGAGTVLLWDRGYWTAIGDPRSSYHRGRLKFHLDGKKLQGIWNLVRMGGHQETGKENWLLIKENDEEARSGNNSEVTQNTHRKRGERAHHRADCIGPSSGVAFEPIAGEQSRTGYEVATGGCHTVGRGPAGADTKMDRAPARHVGRPVPEGDEWVHELKYDGYRLLCRIQDGTAALFTRNGHDWTSKLHRIADSVSSLSKQGWLDGEVVALMPDGSISFQALQNAFDTRSETNLVYYVFDLLYLDGYDLMKTPLIDRKRMLASLLEQSRRLCPDPLQRSYCRERRRRVCGGVPERNGRNHF